MALGMPVGEMLDRMSAAELGEWMIYDQIDPIGRERDDWHAALIASTMASLWGKKRTKPADFMPKFEAQQRRKHGSAELLTAFMAATHSKGPIDGD